MMGLSSLCWGAWLWGGSGWSGQWGGEASAVVGVGGAGAGLGVGDGCGDGVGELGDCLCGKDADPLVPAVVGDELLDEFDVASGSLDEASGVQYGAWWESDFLGFGDGGQGGEVAAGAEDDDGDARAGQAGGGRGQVAAGGGDALGDQDRGLAVAGAGGPAEGDGVDGGELVQSSDDVVEEFLGALRVVAHVRPSGNEAVGAGAFLSSRVMLSLAICAGKGPAAGGSRGRAGVGWPGGQGPGADREPGGGLSNMVLKSMSQGQPSARWPGPGPCQGVGKVGGWLSDL